ncbi:MAG: STAS domain-containing protein [Actinobacteria bacterium]|nr:STAS domain-containing protein [Actinomycetota bacterium]
MLTARLEHEPEPVIYLAGEMDLDCVDLLRETVEEAGDGAAVLILDFADVTFIDSSGTGIFVRLCLDLQVAGIKLRARHIPPVVAQVFDMLKVHALVGDEVFLS